MKNHTCTGDACHTCTKNKSMMVAVGVSILIIVGIVIAVRSSNTSVADVAQNVESSVTNTTDVVTQKGERLGQGVRNGVSAGQGAARKATAAAQNIVADTVPAQVGGAYVVYAPELIGKTDRTILSFSATWCPSCQAFDKDIVAKTADIPADVTVLKVDYDTYVDLKKKYGVRSQHTFVEVDKNGAPLKTVIGSANLAALVDDLAL